jgi:hypothetical protein
MMQTVVPKDGRPAGRSSVFLGRIALYGVLVNVVADRLLPPDVAFAVWPWATGFSAVAAPCAVIVGIAGLFSRPAKHWRDGFWGIVLGSLVMVWHYITFPRLVS